ncbi:DUF6173 family protein [Yersinia enterocolitica]|uniref:DUF6173 family protein n=1 Tax=Yersinia enterocolitica TaxID=630 RepID=UPI0022FE77E0|nr:DUF6173 family protein [Yersinia enterocolitica]MDA5531721.1 DUF6173 family protein [Yersinia enterocolitica]
MSSYAEGLNQSLISSLHRDAALAATRNFSVSGNFADQFHLRIIQWINTFHRELEAEYEVGGQLASFGQSITFTFTDIGYWNPSLISFKGLLDDGSPVELVQHVSQINVLLIRRKRENPTEPRRPIGFANWDDYDRQLKEWNHE